MQNSNYNTIQIIISIIFIFSIYWNSITTGNFVYDDAGTITGNSDIIDPSINLLDIIQHDFWGKKMTEFNSHKSYRPITVLSFKLSYYLYNGLSNPSAFHFDNVILHIITCLLIFSFCKLKLKFNFNISLGSMILFGTHPIHTEAVSNVTGRAEILSAIFLLLSLITFSNNNFYLLLSSCILAILSTLCKETGITTFGLLFIISFCNNFNNNNVNNNNNNMKKKTILLFHTFIFLIFGGSYAYLRIYLCDGIPLSPVFSNLDNPLISYTGVLLFINRAWNHAYYFKLLILPTSLSCDYSAHCISVISDILDIRSILGIILYISIIVYYLYHSFYLFFSHSNYS
jgi:protein O-mannosyl-transferase